MDAPMDAPTCTQCKKYYGSPDTEDLCSKCYSSKYGIISQKDEVRAKTDLVISHLALKTDKIHEPIDFEKRVIGMLLPKIRTRTPITLQTLIGIIYIEKIPFNRTYITAQSAHYLMHILKISKSQLASDHLCHHFIFSRVIDTWNISKEFSRVGHCYYHNYGIVPDIRKIYSKCNENIAEAQKIIAQSEKPCISITHTKVRAVIGD